MNDKQLLTRFLKCLAFCLAIALLLCSTAMAQQLAPNPNPPLNTISVTGSADNFEYFFNFGNIDIDYLGFISNWFVIDSSLAKLYLNWLDRVPLEFEMDPTSDFRLEARFRGYMRYSWGWSDWRWLYGHTVT